MIHIRCSALGPLMTPPKSVDERLVTEDVAAILKKKVRTDEEKAILQHLLDRSLSAGAKTEIEKMAKEYVYGFHEVVTSKFMDKGLIVEPDSLDLYNTVFFTDYQKNTERKNNEWLTGECDIFVPSTKIIDLKSAWSLATFPATAAAGRDTGYEWQGRGYMMLWDVDLFDIAYCMVNTPDELIRYEQQDLHYVDHIDPALRVTIVPYTRDKALEEKIKRKVDAARLYLAEQVNDILTQHHVSAGVDKSQLIME